MEYFGLGDKIVITGDFNKGATGTIICRGDAQRLWGVRFDNLVDYGCSLGGKCLDGYGLWIAKSSMTHANKVFKVGDRVVVNENTQYPHRIGEVGTVIEYTIGSNCVGIDFDQSFVGAHDCGGMGAKNGYFIETSDLIPISESDIILDLFHPQPLFLDGQGFMLGVESKKVGDTFHTYHKSRKIQTSTKGSYIVAQGRRCYITDFLKDCYNNVISKRKILVIKKGGAKAAK